MVGSRLHERSFRGGGLWRGAPEWAGRMSEPVPRAAIHVDSERAPAAFPNPGRNQAFWPRPRGSCPRRGGGAVPDRPVASRLLADGGGSAVFSGVKFFNDGDTGATWENGGEWVFG